MGKMLKSFSASLFNNHSYELINTFLTAQRHNAKLNTYLGMTMHWWLKVSACLRENEPAFFYVLTNKLNYLTTKFILKQQATSVQVPVISLKWSELFSNIVAGTGKAKWECITERKWDTPSSQQMSLYRWNSRNYNIAQKLITQLKRWK